MELQLKRKYTKAMKDQIRETPITPDNEYSETALNDHKNFAIISLPSELGDAQAIQNEAVEWVKNDDWLNAKDGNDLYSEDVPLEGLETDATQAVSIPACEPLVRYYAGLAKSWGFTDGARLSTGIQMDKTSNPNEHVHRDGIGARSMLAVDDGKNVRAVRFVYPIGRPGTILYPDIDHVGDPIDWKSEVITDATEEDHLKSPHFISADGEEKQRLLNEGGAVQVMPGATLVFDMTKSPWHVAPDRTPGGAVMTVDVFESW